MPKISTYTTVIPSLDDKLIGSDVTDNLETKNFTVGSIADLIQKSTLSLSLSASSTDLTIEPTSLDTLQIVNFGVAQANVDVALSASGRISFNTAAWYNVEFNAGVFAPLGNTKDKNITFVAIQKNGALHGLPTGYSIPLNKTLKTTINHSQSFMIEVEVGDYLEFFVLRDSAGTNTGGLSNVRTDAAGPLAGMDAPVSIISVHKIN